MTRAEQNIDYLRSQLEKIRLGQPIALPGGIQYTFRTDAGTLVDRDLEYAEHPDAMPSIVFYPGDNTSSLETEPLPELGMENHTQDFTVEGFIESDKAGTEGDLLRADLSAAIKADPYWGGLIECIVTCTTSSSVQVGDIVFAIVKVAFSVLYTVPYGSE